MNKKTVEDEVSDEELQKIKEEFKEADPVKLRINRVPKKVSDDLKDDAEQMFFDDYGMALAYWHKVVKGDVSQMQTQISDLHERVVRLEQKVEELINDDQESTDVGGPQKDVLNGE